MHNREREERGGEGLIRGLRGGGIVAQVYNIAESSSEIVSSPQ